MAYIFNPFTGSFDSSPAVPLVDGLYLPLSGGTLTGLLSTTDSVYVDGSFETGTGGTVSLFVDDNLVGVNTETPNEALTIVGNVSATGTVYSAEGSSVEWKEAYTNLVSNSATYLSSVDLSFLSVSANWDSVYSTVGSNSANWETAYDISTAYSLASSAFLTSETDSQTLSFDEGTKDLSISNGNTVSLSAFGTGADMEVRALTANWENTYNTVQSNSSIWVDHVGLYLPLSGGTLTGLLSSTDSIYVDGAFEAGSGGTVALFVDNNLVGINTETPNEALTIVGNVSATGTVYSAEGSSVEWKEAYTNLVSNSAAYLSSGGGSGGVSGDYLPLSGGLMSGPIGFGDVNGGTIYTGYYDSNRSGLSGISLICSVNYDLNWQAGWITSLQQDRVTPMPLYIDSGAGTSLRVWNGAYVGVGTGTEVTHNGITFSDATTQTTAFTGNTLTFDETTKDLTITNGNTVSLSSLVDLTAVDMGVRALTANWESTYTTFRDASSTFLTSETDSQTLSFDEGAKDLTISNGNTVSLSAFGTRADQSLYLPLSGGTLTGLLSSTDSIYINGSLEIGSGLDASLFVDDNLVGINTETPNEALTIVGNVSATGTVYSAEGSSVEWKEAYTNLVSNSAAYLSSGGGGGGVSGDYLPLSGGTLTGLLSTTDSVYVDGAFGAGSGATVSLFIDNNLVGVNTETPNEALTIVGNVSATGTVYSAEGSSVEWKEAYTNLVSNSATYLSSVDLSFLSVSANWDSVYSTVGSNSANWETAYNTVSALSASWSAADEILVAEVTNADSVTLNRGDVVYSFGATGSVMSVKRASNSAEATSSKTLGVINETIIPNGIGYATVAGRIDKMSFSSPFVDGDALWLGSTPGTFTRVKPVAPNNGVYLGVVERANNGNGIAYIKVQNGYELDEIHDVLINGVQAKDLLQRNSTNTLWINGPLSADGSNITSGTINAARMPTFNGDITATTTSGSVSAKVVAIQGGPISTQAPANGQVLQWNGTVWTPGSLPQGGSGGGGLFYFLNQALSAQAPTTNLPLTAHELGRAGLMAQTTYTSPTLSQVAYTLIAGFVTDVLDPNVDAIPGGIWDFNIWGYSNANINNPTVMRAKVYKYDGSNAPVLISTSDDTTLTDSGLFIQHKLSCLISQTSASLTDRIYVELEAKASAGLKTVTLGFGDSTPSHIHTTLPSVGGSGLVKVIDGVIQSPASLLVDVDVASNANIAQSKINGLTDLASQSSSTYTTVNSNSADWSSVYSTVQTNSATTWNYQGTDLKALSGNWQTTYLASSAYVVSDPTGITGASALTKLIQITQAGYNAIITPSSDTLYVIVG